MKTSHTLLFSYFKENHTNIVKAKVCPYVAPHVFLLPLFLVISKPKVNLYFKFRIVTSHILGKEAFPSRRDSPASERRRVPRRARAAHALRVGAPADGAAAGRSVGG